MKRFWATLLLGLSLPAANLIAANPTDDSFLFPYETDGPFGTEAAEPVSSDSADSYHDPYAVDVRSDCYPYSEDDGDDGSNYGFASDAFAAQHPDDLPAGEAPADAYDPYDEYSYGEEYGYEQENAHGEQYEQRYGEPADQPQVTEEDAWGYERDLPQETAGVLGDGYDPEFAEFAELPEAALSDEPVTDEPVTDEPEDVTVDPWQPSQDGNSHPYGDEYEYVEPDESHGDGYDAPYDHVRAYEEYDARRQQATGKDQSPEEPAVSDPFGSDVFSPSETTVESPAGDESSPSTLVRIAERTWHTAKRLIAPIPGQLMRLVR